MTRKPPLAAAAGLLAGAAAWALVVEPRRIVVRRADLQLPRWPRALDGLRVAVVSDLHAGAPQVDERAVARVVGRVNAEHPDLVGLLGDYVDPEVVLGRRVEPEAVAARLGRLRAPLGAFAVLGNHDWREDGERVAGALADAGIAVLENAAVPVPNAPAPLWVAGLADAALRKARPGTAVADVPAEAAVIALSHDPDLFPRIPERVALTLAGHTHSGQVNVPLLRRWAIPSRFGERYARGHVEEHGRHLYVTAGIGTSRLPLRLGAPPEVALLRLLSATP